MKKILTFFKSFFKSKFKNILVLDTEIRDGRFYTKETINSIKRQIENEEFNLGVIDHCDSHIVELKETAFTFKVAKQKSENLLIDINCLKNEKGNFIKQNISKIKFKTQGLGFVNDIGEIEDFQLITIGAFLMEEFKEKKQLIQ